MKPKYIQVNCSEEKGIDLRQSEAVLKYNPDIILLEYPNNAKTPDTIFNSYKPKDKPYDLLKKQADLQKHLNIMPWVKSDIVMWVNIGNLWREGHQILVYKVDAPTELTNEMFEVWKNKYPGIKNNWLWWVRIYLRESIMTSNIKWILNNYKEKQNPVVLVFLQSFHWKHVKFLLENPGKDKIWNYYFGKFSNINRDNIGEKIKRLNKVFYKYWIRFANF